MAWRRRDDSARTRRKILISTQVPSYVAYQQTPLQTFWPVVLLYVGIVEIFSVFTFENPFGKGGFWTLKDDRVRRPRPRLREFGVYLVLTSRMPWPRRGPNVTPSPRPAEQKGIP